MKSFERREKVARAIKMELGNLIQKGSIKDDRIDDKFVSIVDVSLNSSLSSAKVFFSILNQSEDDDLAQLEMQATQAALNDNAGYMRGVIARNLNLKYAPKIFFALGDNLSKAVDMVDLIDRTVSDDDAKRGQ